MSLTVSEANSRAPVSISHSTTPNAQMSARASTVPPRACSGDMYAAVPRITPCIVPSAGDVSVGECVSCPATAPPEAAPPGPDEEAAPTGSIALARPKSRTLTFPSMEAFTF